jgi:hypothetical protein
MSSRRNDHDDPYIRRLDDNIRRAHLDALRAGSEAVAIGEEIGRKARTGELGGLLDRILAERSWIRDQLTSPPLSDRVATDVWVQRLADCPLTGPGAVAQLESLLERVEQERRRWIVGPWTRLETATEQQPVEFSVESWLAGQYQRTTDHLDRSPVESTLRTVVSAVGALISYVRRYESARLR